MRHCVGAVALVTVGTEPGRRTGLTVTSACSLSDDPPSLLVCVNRTASAHALLALTFSGQNGINGDDRFALGRWIIGATGAPLLEHAVAAFDCVLMQEFETETHSVFIGEVRDTRISVETSPLIYLCSSFQSVRDIRDSFALGDLDARRQSWSRFP
jgi:cob(II)yrinic acid a,c-diamide reductase